MIACQQIAETSEARGLIGFDFEPGFYKGFSYAQHNGQRFVRRMALFGPGFNQGKKGAGLHECQRMALIKG